MKKALAFLEKQWLWRLFIRAYMRFERHDGTAMAGYVAFSVFLSLFPFAIFFSALTGILIGPEDSRLVFDVLVELAPPHIAKTLTPVLDEVIGRSRGGLLTLSGLGAIWVASNAVEALRVALDRAYDAAETRSFVRRRVMALGFVLFAGVTFTALGFVIILAPLMIRLAEEWTGFQPPGGMNFVRYLVGLVGFSVFLITLNRLLPNGAPRIRSVLPGVFVATLMWIVGASGFSVYLSYAPSYTVTYGGFAGITITLLFFYLTSAVVIFGAELNAARLALKKIDIEKERGDAWR